MILTASSLFLVLLTINLSFCESYTMNMYCINSTNLTQCSNYGFQLVVSYYSIRFNQIVCVPQNETCQTQNGRVLNYTLTSCSVDSNKSNCSTGICYYHPLKSDKSRNITMCSKCESKNSTNNGSYISTCNNSITDQAKSYDYIGQRCDCCYNNTQKNNQTNYLFCTADNYFLKNSNLTKWFHLVSALGLLQNYHIIFFGSIVLLLTILQ